MTHYLSRTLTSRLSEAFAQEKIVLLLGARQVGKSTLLKNNFPELSYFTLDPLFDEYNLRQQPDLFLKSFSIPLILDEVQFYPEILTALKRFADIQEQPGQYLLTGSQNFSMLKTVSESMAGRVAILELNPMTFLERYQIIEPYWIDLLLKNQRSPYLIVFMKSSGVASYLVEFPKPTVTMRPFLPLIYAPILNVIYVYWLILKMWMFFQNLYA